MLFSSQSLRIKVPFFSQRLCIKVPFSEVAPCPFEILARTLNLADPQKSHFIPGVYIYGMGPFLYESGSFCPDNLFAPESESIRPT